jgi:hypothetical protein
MPTAAYSRRLFEAGEALEKRRGPRIARNLREFRSGAIGWTLAKRERCNNFRVRLVKDGR